MPTASHNVESHTYSRINPLKICDEDRLRVREVRAMLCGCRVSKSVMRDVLYWKNNLRILMGPSKNTRRVSRVSQEPTTGKQQDS